MSHDALTPLVVVCRGAVCSVLPVPANAYRPYALRHPVLAFVNAIILGTVLGTSLLLSLTPEVARLSTITAPTIVRLTNAERVKAGLQALRENSTLARSAQLKGEHMLRYDYFDHNFTDQDTDKVVNPWSWFTAAGYDYRFAGENLAIDFTTAEDVTAAWMTSPGHRRNLLSERYDDLGIAVVTGEFEGRTVTITVQHFGRTQTSTVPTAHRSPSRSVAPSVSTAPERAPSLAPAPLATPTLTEPTENATVTRRTLRVRGTAPAAQRVEVRIDGESAMTVSVGADGTFEGTVSLPDETERTVTLTAVALASGQLSRPSPPLRVLVDTKAPTVVTENVLVLPDPQGLPGSVIVAVPTPADAARADLVFRDERSVPLQRQGNVLVASLPTLPEGAARLRVWDERGNTRLVEVSLPFQYSTVALESRLPRTQLVRALSQTRPWLIGILWVLAATLVVNLTVHLRVRRLLHPDLIAHGAFALLVGTVTLWIA